MELSRLERVLKQAWCMETSSDPDRWTESNPAWGQCAVTACIVDDYFGGRLLWAEAQLPDGEKISHYSNELPDRSIVDLTRQQFPAGTTIPSGVDKKGEHPTTRDRVLSFQQTADRYELLKNRVELLLR